MGQEQWEAPIYIAVGRQRPKGQLNWLVVGRHEMELPQASSQAFLKTAFSFLKVLKMVYSVLPKSREVILQTWLINQSCKSVLRVPRMCWMQGKCHFQCSLPPGTYSCLCSAEQLPLHWATAITCRLVLKPAPWTGSSEERKCEGGVVVHSCLPVWKHTSVSVIPGPAADHLWHA